jgi:hypothetical protein
MKDQDKHKERKRRESSFAVYFSATLRRERDASLLDETERDIRDFYLLLLMFC